jgi:BirA family biotin operon repressor/biotin-[acetyl-CoA-carboxylase] ligase
VSVLYFSPLKSAGRTMKKLKPTFKKLIAILNDGQYHDGTTLGDKLKITRSAVWKTIQKLHTYGIPIESLKGKGYALTNPLILLNKTYLKKNLQNKSIAIDIFETIDSTNDYLKLCIPSATPHVCLAEQQTQGKGRFQRHWYSPFGLNLYVSCLYPFQKDMSAMAGLSLVVSLAIVKALGHYNLPAGLGIKWPNDVLHDHKKLAGSLIEVQAESNGTCYANIGIGMNVNMLEDKNQRISQPWTSLGNMTGAYIDRNELAVALINELITYLKRFDKFSLASFMTEWKQLDYLRNESLTLASTQQQTFGVAQGINEFGHLLLKLPDGSVQAFSSGDTSVMRK